VVAVHVDDVALRLEAHGRPVGDPDLDELADLRASGTARSDQHFLLDLRVVRHHEADAAFLEVAPHHGFVGTRDDLHQAAFAAAAAVEAGNAGQRPVAIEHQADLRRAEEEVVAAVVGNQEAEAVAVTADAPGDQVGLVDRGVGAAPGKDELSVALHGAQAAAQGLLLFFAVQPELFDQLLTGCRRTTL